LREADRSIAGFRGMVILDVPEREVVDELAPLAADLLSFERNEHDGVATLRKRRTIPTPMKRDEGAASILRGERTPVIEQKIARRPMRGERDDRILILAWRRGRLPVAAILRRDHSLAASNVEVRVRPAIVSAFAHQMHLFGDCLRVVLFAEVLRPQRVELIAPVNDDEQRVALRA